MSLTPDTLNVGDMFYECESGMNIEATVKTQPELKIVEDDESWSWLAEDDNGNCIKYLWSKKYNHYGPRLYKTPQYCSSSEGGFTFKTTNGNTCKLCQ